MATREQAIAMIQKLLASKGVQEKDSKDDHADIWYLKKGSAQFHIKLTHFEQLGKTQDGIAIVAPIMPLPADAAKEKALYQELLRLNAYAVGMWFGVLEGMVFLIAGRELNGLDYEELDLMGNNIAEYADYFDDLLKEQFGS